MEDNFLKNEEEIERHIKKEYSDSYLNSSDYLFIIGAGFNISLTQKSHSWDKLIKSGYKKYNIKNRELINKKKIKSFGNIVLSGLIPHNEEIYEEIYNTIKEKNLKREAYEISNLFDNGNIDILTTNYVLPLKFGRRDFVKDNDELQNWLENTYGTQFYIHGNIDKNNNIKGNFIFNNDDYHSFYSENYKENSEHFSNFLKKRGYKKIVILGMSGKDNNFLSFLTKNIKKINDGDNIIETILYLSDFHSKQREREMVFEIMKKNYQINKIYFFKKSKFKKSNFIEILRKILIDLNTKLTKNSILTQKIIENNENITNILKKIEVKTFYDKEILTSYLLEKDDRIKEFISYEQNWKKNYYFIYDVLLKKHNLLKREKINELFIFWLSETNWIFDRRLYKEIKMKLNYENRKKYLDVHLNYSNTIRFELDFFDAKHILSKKKIFWNDEIILGDLEIEEIIELILLIAKEYDDLFWFLNWKNKNIFNIFAKKVIDIISKDENKIKIIEELIKNKEIKEWKYLCQIIFQATSIKEKEIFLEDFGFKHEQEYIEVLCDILPKNITKICFKEKTIDFTNKKYYIIEDTYKVIEKSIKKLIQDNKLKKYLIKNDDKEWKINPINYTEKNIEFFPSRSFDDDKIYSWEKNPKNWKDPSFNFNSFNLENLYHKWKNNKYISEDIDNIFIELEKIEEYWGKVDIVIKTFQKYISDSKVYIRLVLDKLSLNLSINIKKIEKMCSILSKNPILNNDIDLQKNNPKNNFYFMVLDSKYSYILKNIEKILKNNEEKGFELLKKLLSVKKIHDNCKYLKEILISYFFNYIFKDGIEKYEGEENIFNRIKNSNIYPGLLIIILWRIRFPKYKVDYLNDMIIENKEYIEKNNFPDAIAQSIILGFFIKKDNRILELIKNNKIKRVLAYELSEILKISDYKKFAIEIANAIIPNWNYNDLHALLSIAYNDNNKILKKQFKELLFKIKKEEFPSNLGYYIEIYLYYNFKDSKIEHKIISLITLSTYINSLDNLKNKYKDNIFLKRIISKINSYK